ncbi:MAG: SOS response-associated peptidase [Eubacteriales bacterium]|nr:SOS response-associated peptidase [Eubacteriales bacterium]
MCGRYNVDDAEDIYEMREIMEEVFDRYQNTPELASMKTGEIFPTNAAPIIAADNPSSKSENSANMPDDSEEQTHTGRRMVRLMKWGFPRFDGAGVIINARIETALEKNIFRSSILSRRCVVPTTGFFEWKQPDDGGKKIKYLIRQKDSPMLYLAGFFNTFKDKQGLPVMSYVILTTAANESVSQIHNRMPVILAGEKMDSWIFDNSSFQEILSERFENELLLLKCE